MIIGKKNIKSKAMGEEPIVVIDLGSCGVTAMAAEPVFGGQYRVLAVQKSTKFAKSVEHGVVKNVANVAFMVNEAINLLSNRLGTTLTRAYLVLSGKSVQLTHVHGEMSQIIRRPVTPNEIEEVKRVCTEKLNLRTKGKMQVLELQPMYFELDEQRVDGVPGPEYSAVNVKGHYVAYLADTELVNALDKVVERSKLQLEARFNVFDCQMAALTSADEQDEGVAIIDMGAATTSYCICHKGQLINGLTLPIGGDDITRAISEGMGMSLQMAEHIKRQCGKALERLVTEDKRVRLSSERTGDNLVISFRDLAATIERALDSTLGNIIQKINTQAANVKKIYLTGGGAWLEGIEQYVRSRTLVPVEYGAYTEWLDESMPDEFFVPEYSALVGAVSLADMHREEHKNEQKKQSTRKGGDKIKEKLQLMLNIFDTPME